MSAKALARRILNRALQSRFLAVPAEAPAESGNSWWRGEPVPDEMVNRLVALGLDRDEILNQELRRCEGPLFRDWAERGSAMYVSPAGTFSLDLVASSDSQSASASNFLFVLCADLTDIATFHSSGSGGTVYIGPYSALPHAQIACGSASSIVVAGMTNCMWNPTLDARNGGSIFVGWDQLWASDVRITTDDMHRLEDAQTGQRVNGYGSRITLGQHVWVGRDAVLTGNLRLGNDCVVGLRAVVRNAEFGDGAAVAGMPGRQIRSGISWSREDLP